MWVAECIVLEVVGVRGERGKRVFAVRVGLFEAKESRDEKPDGSFVGTPVEVGGEGREASDG